MTSRYFSLMAGLLLLACVGVATAANITFQVNMAVQERLGNFTPATDTVLVRGNVPPLSWDGYDLILTTTAPDSVYRITVVFDSGAIEYKFVMANRDAGDDRWEGVDNRTYTVTAEDDTLDVVYYNNQTSSAIYDLEVLFRVDMRVQELMGNFDPLTDVVMVRGGTPPLEWGGSANQLPEVTGSPGLYADWIEFDDLPYPGTIGYKFVILTDGDPNSPIWEQIPGGGNRSVNFTGTEPDNLPPPSGNGYAEILLDTVFFSEVSFEDITQNPVDVTFTCDVRPAYYKIDDIGYLVDIQTGDTIWSVDNVGVNGLFDRWTWGDIPETQQLRDDGVAPDEVAGDSIWAVAVNIPVGSQRSHPYKYGVNDYDDEAGYEQDHRFIVDDSQPTQVLPLDCFGILGDLYDDYIWVCESATEPTAGIAVPQELTLYQNYPNPFNPSTRIAFSLPAPEKVTLRVLNILGQEVAVMDLGRLSAGHHAVGFSAEKLVSGIYFYRVEAGSMNAVRKMLVLK
ncbi:MAG: carbohydrate-binding module family 20 domain-containing protein [bacterium]